MGGLSGEVLRCLTKDSIEKQLRVSMFVYQEELTIVL